MIAAGQSIGNYRILNKIGTGGMGAVYLAEHPLIGKRVALKVIHRELSTNKEVVQRFFQEAKAVNKIGNEHIVEVHDFGQTPEGDHFYIMEFLEGKNLASVLHQEHVIPIVRALHIAAQVASALAAAHASGVIHRDLKPDNVMLTMRLGDPDFVKLLDFGLAKIFAGGPSAVKTAVGVLLGTPQYMSPEACESKGVDHRTDIYALGILLFQMTTGRLPFEGETMGELLVKQVTQLPPPPRGFNPNVPPSVEQIILRCLAKQPDARFQTMLALREALLEPDRYLANSPPITPTRSLAPGESKVDAKTIMAYAAQQQAGAAGQATRMMEAPYAPPQAAAKTIMAGSVPMPAAAPMLPMPVPNPIAVGQADLSLPAPLSTHTMQIATPLGYVSHPPRRMLPIVLVVSGVLGLVGGGFAVARFKHGGRDDTEAQSPVIEAKAVPTSSGHAGLKGVPDPAPAPAPPAPQVQAPTPTPTVSPMPAPPPVLATAMIEIDSTPAGAEVYDGDEHLVGKTPAKLTLPIATTALSYELRLGGYRTTVKQFMVTGNATFQVPLQPVEQPQPVVHHPLPAPVTPTQPTPHPTPHPPPTQRPHSDDLEPP